jgi:hypothetical protein
VINLVSYFEIGGKLVECLVYQGDAREPNFFQPMDELGVMVADVAVGVAAKTVAKAAGKDSYDPLRASRAPGRFRRARYALTLAGTLAAADGPLPFGDALAIGVLGSYATYEVVTAVGDLRQ